MTTAMPDRTWPGEWPPDYRRAAERGQCLHCGNALGRTWDVQQGPFCCRGCTQVHRMISQGGLERFYDLKPPTLAPAALLRPDSFAWLDRLLAERDDPAGGPDGGGPLHLDLDIQGVHCAACVWLIEELFRRRPAGVHIRINPALGKVELAWDPRRGDLKEFLGEVERFGYRLGPSVRGARRQSRELLMRMAVSIAMAMNVMMFSLSFYFGLAEGNLYRFFGWLSLGMATVSLAAGGGIFFRGALAGLRRRVLHLDVPIALGMLLAYVGSVYGFLRGGPDDAYFDSLTVFIALMLVGRWAQEHILERNRNALLETTGVEHLTVKRREADGLRAVGAATVRRGQELWIAPGDLLPVAGILMRRSCEVSLDWITGESDRVAFAPGDTVPAGAFNASAVGFGVTAAEDFADSRLQDLLLTPAQAGPDARARWWHRVSGWYVSAVLAAAVMGFLLWLPAGLTPALRVTIAVLVVTCPCALGLAIPLAEELVHGALRRAGIFLRKGDFLAKALAVRTILLDKTGTLTLGRLRLEPQSARDLDALDPHARRVLRRMTARSNHPVSVCLQAALDRDGDRAATAAGDEDLQEIPGRGLSLALPDGLWRLGRADFAAAAAPAADGPAATVFSCDGRVLAGLAFREDFKADARAEIAALGAEGYDLYLLSGDAQAKVDRAAAALGIDAGRAWGDLDPQAKAERVRALDRRDTLMVGDGLNDSPSFAAALCAATPAVDRPVLPGKADFYFLGDGIAALGRALTAAHRLRGVVRANLAAALIYNLAAVALALAGLVTPVVAAILMPVSSVAVVTLTALRLSPRRLRWTSS